jgi:hypothetical protein
VNRIAEEKMICQKIARDPTRRKKGEESKKITVNVA